MIPRLIHTATMGGYKMSDLGVSCRETWQRVMPDYEIRVWTDDTIQKSEWCKSAIAAGKPVNASHWAQWWALYEYGGVFLDNDMLAVRPFDLNHEVFCGLQRIDPVEFCVNNAVVGAVPRHPFVLRILMQIERADPAGFPLVTGPGILTDTLIGNGLETVVDVDQQVGDVMVYSRDRFFPWFHSEPPIPVDKLTERTFACHLWEGSWNK
jgi:mannosyltransferase OCH1-like enzyme